MRKLLAQRFKITGLPAAVDSIYLDAIGIMFKHKDGARGIAISICEVVNGVPDQTKVLLHSQKHLLSHEVTAVSTATSSQASLTRFVFDGQVHLQTNKEYAILLQPDGGAKNYRVWKAKVGRNHLTKVGHLVIDPTSVITYTGLLRSYNRGKHFEDHKINNKKFLQMAFYGANFGTVAGGGGGTTNTSINGYVTFVNNPDVDFFNVSSLTSNNILAGDILVGGNTTVANARISGVVTTYNPTASVLYIKSSTGNFTANTPFQVYRLGESNYSNLATLQTAISNTQVSTAVANGTIVSIYDLPYHTVVPKVDVNLPAGTSYSISLSTILGANASYAQIPATQVVNNTDNDLSSYAADRYIISYSNNPTLAYPSISMTVNMSSNSQYKSPSIKPTDLIVVTNKVDSTGANTYGEYGNYGSAFSKYISKPITLASGQDAEDIKAYLTAYRPVGTDVKMYVKFLSSQDPASIADKTWTLLTNDTPSVYSDQLDKDNFIEYTFSAPTTINNPATYLLGSGTIATSNTSNVVTGNVTVSNTSFNTQLLPGQILYNSSNVYIGTIAAITNSSSLTLTSNAAYTLAANVFNYSTSGFIPPQTNAFLNVGNLVAKTGTLSVSNSSATVTGTSTLFNTELAVSNYISVNGEQKYIVSIANSTSLTVDSPFAYTNSGISYSQVLPSGMTYTDAGGTTYVKYTAFQIKVVMQADTGVLYPKLKDLRAIALQT